MKSILLSLAVAFLLPIAAQSQDYQVDQNGNVVFTRIADIPGLSAGEIYTKANDAIVFIYKDAKYVIQQTNSEGNYLILKGVFLGFGRNTAWGDRFDCNYLLRIDCKDGKMRMQVILTTYDMVSLSSGDVETVFVSKTVPIDPEGRKPSGMKKAFPNLLAEIEALTVHLEENVKKNSAATDNW